MSKTTFSAMPLVLVAILAQPSVAQPYRGPVAVADWPEAVMCGESFTVDVTMTNPSRINWTEAGFFKLGPVLGEDEPFRSDGHKFKMPDGTEIPYGGKHTFALELTAPDETGTYETQWAMMREGRLVSSSIRRSIRVFCDHGELGRALFPSDVRCGQSFSAEVRMRNTGKSTWTEAKFYKLGPVTGVKEPFRTDGHKFKMPDGTEVAPGEKYVFELELTAPEEYGTYDTRWTLMKGGNPFGEEISRTIDVKCKR